MKIIFKKPLWFTVITTLCLVVITLFAVVSCNKSDIIPPKVSFTLCQQSELRSSNEFSNTVDVEFTGKGIQITYYNFAVTCDFTTINVTHTFVNGVLNITQQGSPNQADCICYTDVSCTIDGISQNEVNVIFINGVQVYCHNENYPIEVPFTEYSLAGTFCQWTNLNYDNKIIVINSNEKLTSYINCLEGNYPEFDFSTHTLLLAHGMAPSSVVNVSCSNLQQFSEQSYEMEVEIVVGNATVISNWQVPIIINRLDERCIIELIVAIK